MTFDEQMTALASAIRTKSGVSGGLTVTAMTAAVNNISVGSDIDLSGVNVTADKLLDGVVAVDGSGNKVTGNIETVSAYEEDGNVIVPKGFIETEQTFEIDSGGYDTSEVTVTSDAMLSGYVAIGPDGERIDGEIENTRLERPGDPNIVCIEPGYVEEYQEIEIPTVSAVFEDSEDDVVRFVVGEGYIYDTEIELPVVGSINVDANVVSVSAGYVKDSISAEIPEATVTETDNSVSIGVGYISEPLSYDLSSGGEGSGSTVSYGYITADGKVQKLNIDGEDVVTDGDPVEMEFSLFNTGVAEPEYGSSISPGGSGAFNLAKVTEYSPAAGEVITAVTSIDVSGIGNFIYEEEPEYSEYYEDANGRYVVTAATAGETDWTKRVYKHESKDYYLYYEYYSEYPEESTWFFGTSNGGGGFIQQYYDWDESENIIPVANLESGEYAWGNYDWEPFMVTLSVHTTTSESSPMVLKGVLATEYIDGEWSFAEAEQSFTSFEQEPKKNYIYVSNENSLIGSSVAFGVNIPQNGLVFYAPLDKDASTAVTGQSLSRSGTVTYETVDGVPMANFTNGYIYVQNAAPTGNNSLSISFYAKTLKITDNWPGLIQLSTASGDFLILYSDNEQCLSTGARAGGQDVFNLLHISTDLTALQHFVLTYNNETGIVRAYRNGSFVSEVALTGELNQQSDIRIGRTTSDLTFPGGICAVRIYNRALFDKEIEALSEEFNVL